MTTDPVLTQCTCYGLEASNKKSVRLELYSELLLALTLSDGTCSLTEYYARLKYVSPTIQLDSSDGLYQYEAALRAVYDYLHMIPFYVAVVKKGVFGHLGTSSEFVELLNIASARKTEGTTASTLSSSHIRTNTRDKNMKFAIKYDLRQVLGGAIVVPYQPSRPPIRVLDHVKGTSVNSLVHLYSIDNATSTTILSGTVGVDSVIEHSMLSGQFSIGRNCYISHIQSELGHNLQIHDNMMFQQAPLQSSSTLSSSSLSESVLILLGMNDDMKAQYDSAKATIWGGAWSHLLQSISIGLQDRGSGDVVDFLWDNSEADKSLWTAKIFTLWSPDQFILSFMQAVHTYDWTDEKFIQVIPEYILLGLSEFVNAPVRYSLADLLKKADAGAMHRWRCFVYVSVDTFYPAASRDSLRAVVCRTNHVDISKEEEVERDKRSLINSSFQINEPVTKVELGIISDSHMTTIMHQIYESCHTQLTKLSSTLKAHYLSKLVKSQISTTACSSKEEGTSSIDTVDTLEISAALVLLGQMLHTISAPTNQAQTVAIFAQMLSTLSMSTPFNLLNMKILSEDASFLRVAYSDTNFACTDSYLSAPLEVTSKFSQLISNYFRSFLSPITTILLARTLLGESVFKSLPSEFLPRYLFVCSWLCNGQKIATVTYEEASSVFSISQDSTLQDKVTELHNEVNVRVQRVFQRLLELASMSHNRLLTKNSNFDNKSDISSTNITLSDLLERSAHVRISSLNSFVCVTIYLFILSYA